MNKKRAAYEGRSPFTLYAEPDISFILKSLPSSSIVSNHPSMWLHQLSV
jgi:hypothetical protein